MFWRRCVAAAIIGVFSFTNTVAVYAQSISNLPVPGTRVGLSAQFQPALLKAVKVHTDNPFQFDFIVDTGDSVLEGQDLKDESSRLIKYFLAALTTPEDDLWVNLSPSEKDRIIPESFGKTEMGRDLLAQDYILKQISASLLYPEEEFGKRFWEKVKAEAKTKYGVTDMSFNTFNKVWIVPEKTVVYESGTTAYVSEARFKVMIEKDYLTLQNNKANSKPSENSAEDRLDEVSSKIMREIVIPQLEKEVNTGKNFASIRQVLNSLVLAYWYKQRLKDSILSKLYSDKNKVTGVDIEDKTEAQQIYNHYLAAFKKGVYNYIKEDYDSVTQTTVPRKYFSGGALMTLREGQNVEIRPGGNFSGVPGITGNAFDVSVVVNPEQQAPNSLASTNFAHVRNFERLERILRLVAKAETGGVLSAKSTPAEIFEFLIDRLKQKGLVNESVDESGNVILRITQQAQQDRLGDAIYRWVVNPTEGLGAPAVNFQSSAEGAWKGQWLIIGLESELNNPGILRHEQEEANYRRANPNASWVEAHNAVVRKLNEGVLISDEALEKGPGSGADLGSAIGDWWKRFTGSNKFEADIDQLRRQGARIIETDMTLDYGGLDKWNVVRILVDFVQNHKPADSKGTRTDVTFHLKDGRVLTLSDAAVKDLTSEQVDYIEIADDGIGYDADHLKYFLTTKGSAEEGGKFGEGLKIATAAALKRGFTVEFQSRNWQARPVVSKKTLNEGFPNEITTYNISFAVINASQIAGSRTIIRSPDSDLLEASKNLPNLVLALRSGFTPLSHDDTIGEIVEATSQGTSAVYVKGNHVMYLPDNNVSRLQALFSYNLFDDATLGRDRDTVPRLELNTAVQKLLIRNVNPDVIKKFIEASVVSAVNGKVEGADDRYYEQGLGIWRNQLEDMSSEGAELWRNVFYTMFGENAFIGEFDSRGNLTQSTENAISSGKTPVYVQGAAVAFLEHAGVKRASQLYFSKEVKVDTGLTLSYRESAWGYDRILIDAVQNHLGADSGATQVKVEFLLKGQENQWIDLNRIGEYSDDQIAALRISDNGNGYDYRLLGLLHSTKAKVFDAAGGWGEGLKMLSAAALRAGLGLELRSRDWQAEAATEKKYFNNAEGALVDVDALNYKMVSILGEPLQGSQTIFTKLNPEFLVIARNLQQKALTLNTSYAPVSRTSVGEIVTFDRNTTYVQGLEVTDAVNDHRTLMAYNFLGINGIIVSPDRNVLHAGKVKEAVGRMMAETTSVEALTIVLTEAVDQPGNYHPEFQDATKNPNFTNQETWRLAWDRVVQNKQWDVKKVVIKDRSLDLDAQILLRNMGYEVLEMDSSIANVVHSLGVHYGTEILNPVFEYISIDELTPQERQVLELRTLIDRKLAEVLGLTFSTSPIEIFTSVRSTLTGEELSGWHGYWETKTERIGIIRSQLRSPIEFGMTYLEEMGHRLSQADDYTREFTNFFRNTLVQEIFRQNGISLEAIASENPGGIDLTSDRLNVDIQNRGNDFEFDIDPAQWQDVTISGFVPVIINIAPVTDLPLFLSGDTVPSEKFTVASNSN